MLIYMVWYAISCPLGIPNIYNHLHYCVGFVEFGFLISKLFFY